MQNRYVGDVGDYFKYTLLRALKDNQKLGVAWYLYPDEAHNEDGKHTSYLQRPELWRSLDPLAFDVLRAIVQAQRRNVEEVEKSKILGDALFFGVPLKVDTSDPVLWRREWFQRLRHELRDARIVFADPDNGLREDEKVFSRRRGAWNGIPLSEVSDLAAERTLIVYHHNTRWPGGHSAENQHWSHRLRDLPNCRIVHLVRFRRGTARTFFILNATDEVLRRLHAYKQKWVNSGVE